jgi:hypothetical protein
MPPALDMRRNMACTSGVTEMVKRILGVGGETMVHCAPVCTKYSGLLGAWDRLRDAKGMASR